MCPVMMMSLVTLLLASTAISVTTGRMIQLNNNDKNSFVNEHNLLRGKVSPAAVNMEQLVCVSLSSYGNSHVVNRRDCMPVIS